MACEHSNQGVVEIYGLDATRCLDCDVFLDPCEHPEIGTDADEHGAFTYCTFCHDRVIP